MKRIVAKLGEPVLLRRVNGWMTLGWVVMIPVSFAAGWVKSVAYVSALSLWALVASHWSAWQAARVEVAQGSAADEFVEAIVERTDVTSSDG